MRSVMQCRPNLRYHVSELHGVVNKTHVEDLEERNHALDQTQAHSDAGITFRSDAVVVEHSNRSNCVDHRICARNVERNMCF